MSKNMITDTKFNIPRIESIPTNLYECHDYEDTFILLGFKPSGFTNQRIYSNGVEKIKVNIVDNGFQWIFQFPGVCANKRTISAPYEISIQENLTLIEILAVLSREWERIFNKVDIPDDINFGHLYSEHIKKLKLSRPAKPFILVERDVFRFTINKIKKEFKAYDPNDTINISLRNNILNLDLGVKNYPIQVLKSENFNNENISILLRYFINMIPKRFKNETVYLNMINNGLSVDNNILKASWDGANIWEFDNYDEFLSNRLLQRHLWFEG